MALITCNFCSKSLMRMVPINVILPTDKIIFPGQPQPEEHPFKTLYLLHGIFGNYTDWVTGTRLQAWAQDRNLAVVMPSGDNSFYVDNRKTSALYGSFISKDLVEFTRRSFPLSRKREDTFIGGLSMGGFGAIVNGLQHPETFGCICGLSAALVLNEQNLNAEYTDNLMTNRGYYESVFGELDKVLGGENDYTALAERQADCAEKPKFYLACGTEDGLIQPNHEFRDKLQSSGYDVTWRESAGGHDWKFWDEYILKVMEWLPLGDAVQGVSSGHISE